MPPVGCCKHIFEGLNRIGNSPAWKVHLPLWDTSMPWSFWDRSETTANGSCGVTKCKLRELRDWGGWLGCSNLPQEYATKWQSRGHWKAKANKGDPGKR